MSPANAPSLLREGATIAGKYKVERIIAEGGMGIVVAARHLVLGERVALKFLLPEALANAEAIGRFIREARAASRIKSEHVARVTDVAQLDDGSPFIVMEYLDGADLSTWLIHRGPMVTTQAVDFVLQASEAIAEAHVRGIVHRDLKPSNLFCVTRPDGALSIKVLDFGISKVTSPDTPDHKLTKAESVLGSPVYMSPEQMLRSREVDERTDIWSLGVILFELLTGRTPFEAETVPELAVRVATEPPPALRTILPDVPALLEAAVSRCLEKDRTKRFQSLGEMAVALQDFGTSGARQSAATIVATLTRGDTSNPGVPPGANSSEDRLIQTLPTSPTTKTDLTFGALTAASKSRRAVIAGIGAAVGVVALAMGVGVVTQTRGARAPAASAGTDRAPAPPPTAVPAPVPTTPAMPPATATPSATPSSRVPGVGRPPSASSSPTPRPGKQPPKVDDDRLGL